MVVDLPWLRVQRIRVHGNERVHAGEVAALLEGMTGQSLLAVDLDRWRSRLFASPWWLTQRARRLPGTIDVELRERVQWASRAPARTCSWSTRRARSSTNTGGGMPIATCRSSTGLSRRPCIPPVIDRPHGQLVSRLMSELRKAPHLARRVSQIDAVNVHDVHVILDGDPAVIRLGETRFVERLDSYVSLQATLREQVPDIDYVDVRFGERVTSASRRRPGAGGARRPGARSQHGRADDAVEAVSGPVLAMQMRRRTQVEQRMGAVSSPVPAA